jgi:hypothetical protein
MPTPLEEQDQYHLGRGMMPHGDFEQPKFTETEYQAIFNLRDSAQVATIKCPVMTLVAKAKDFDRLTSLIGYCHEAILSFVQARVGLCYLPDQNLLKKIYAYAYLNDYKDWVIRDGGETAFGQAFESDGYTPRQGWVRFYWK